MKDFEFLSDICEVKFDVASPSTFGSGGDLSCVIYPRTVEELVKTTKSLNSKRIKYIVLGACSNTLISDDGVGGVVVSTQKLRGRTLKDKSIYLLAGERLSSLCKLACENSLSGIEGLCSIPGSIGGGLVMNCGAFGREIGEVVEYADVLIDGEIQRIYAKDLDFAYRSSGLKKLGIAVGTKIKLAYGEKYRIAKDMKGYAIARGKSQPKGKSLGSVFKKSGDVSAGYYIDKTGLKGCKKGGAQISDLHANFILNTGGATSNDFLMLADYARQEVDKCFGIKLEYEVEFVPDNNVASGYIQES